MDDPQASFAHRQEASSAVQVPAEVPRRQSVAHESRFESADTGETNTVGGEVGRGEGAIARESRKRVDGSVEVGGG